MSHSKEIKQSRKGSDLRKRIVTSVAVLSLLLPFIIFGSMESMSWKEYDIFFASTLTFVLGYGMFETVNSSLNHKNKSKEFWTIFLMTLSFVGIFGWFGIGRASGLSINPLVALTALFIAMLISLLVSSITDSSFKNITSVFVIAVITTIFFGVIVYSAEILYWNILLWPIVIAATADIFGYIGGRMFGKTHPFPNISPNKTTEGLIIGAVMGILVGLVWYFTAIDLSSIGYPIDLPISWGFIFSMLPAIFGPMGDLFFSKAKRSIGVKDFASLLPGHGGLLDRIDSHIFASSISLMLLIAMLTI